MKILKILKKIILTKSQFTGFNKREFALRVEKSQRLLKLIEETEKINVDDISSSTKTSEDELYKILGEIAKNRKCSEADAFKALALLSQIGATSPRAQEHVKVTLNGIDFKIGLIRNILKSVTQKRTLRRLAKTYATEFHNMSKKSDIAGNLFNKIKLNYPNANIKDQDRHWYSDYQSDNPDCPETIRHQINTYYQDFILKDKKNK